MGYWREAHRLAWGNRAAWWWKALPAMLILTGRWAFFDLDWHREVLPSIFIIAGGFVVANMLEYGWRLLFEAPSALYVAASARIAELSRGIVELKDAARLDPLEEDRRAHVVEQCKAFTTDEKAALKYLLKVGSLTMRDFSTTAFKDSAGSMRQKAMGRHFLDEGRSIHGEAQYSVKPALAPALYIVLGR